MLQERIKKFYPSIQLPEVFEEDDRGFAKCCHKFLVLAGGDSESWKNDVTSAWIKLADPSDTFSFVLVDADTQIATSYTPTDQPFANEDNAYFTTIHWRDVLASDGPKCYEILVTYNIQGYSGSFSWGTYELKPYSIQNALKTARIRVKFNLNQQIEGINFTGSNVEDSIRFNGQIRKDQPNTEIDNLIYNDRHVETVINENLQTYEIITDPYTDEVLRKFTDLYLLSANEMWISDYNAHSHSYRTQDLPVTIQDTPNKERPDDFSRFEYLTCIVSDRSKTKRTFY
jgi:hypothetical protein